MVFMVQGKAQKWKQLIAFFFRDGAMKSVDVARNLKLIIRELQNIVLIVIATISNQMNANKSAVNRLIEETRNCYIQKSLDYQKFGFEVEGKEIVPLYDNAHLLKGILVYTKPFIVMRRKI